MYLFFVQSPFSPAVESSLSFLVLNLFLFYSPPSSRSLFFFLFPSAFLSHSQRSFLSFFVLNPFGRVSVPLFLPLSLPWLSGHSFFLPIFLFPFLFSIPFVLAGVQVSFFFFFYLYPFLCHNPHRLSYLFILKAFLPHTREFPLIPLCPIAGRVPSPSIISLRLGWQMAPSVGLLRAPFPISSSWSSTGTF